MDTLEIRFCDEEELPREMKLAQMRFRRFRRRHRRYRR